MSNHHCIGTMEIFAKSSAILEMKIGTYMTLLSIADFLVRRQ